jgi:hypothetical protein
LDDEDDAVVTVHVPSGTLWPTMVDLPGDASPWPDVPIRLALVPAGLPLQGAIDMTILQANRSGWREPIGVVVRDSDAAATPLHFMKEVRGSFREVISRLAENANAQITWRENSIEISRDAEFMVPMPPIYWGDKESETVESLLSSIAKNVKVNKATRTISYSASAGQQRRVENVLSGLRARPMLIFECYLWDGLLNDNDEWGINFQQLGKINNGINPLVTVQTGNGATSLSGGLTAAANVVTHGLTINMLENFLKKQGRQRSLLTTRIQIIAGTVGNYDNDGKRRIITGVGQQAVVTGLTTSSLPTTTEKEDIDYGTKLTVTGDAYGGMIWGDVGFVSQVIVDLHPTIVSGIEVDRPDQARRGFHAPIRAIPGSTVILGATQNSVQINSQTGAIGLGNVIPLPSDSSRSDSIEELVLAVKVRIIRYDYSDDRHEPAPAGRAEERHDLTSPVVSTAPLGTPHNQNQAVPALEPDASQPQIGRPGAYPGQRQ